jgi:hypothetical protein
MRIEIPTGGKPIKDPDIKAVYLLNHALKISTERMAKANLQFVISKWQKKINKNHDDTI